MTAARKFPLPPRDDDPRFTAGLVLDLAAVLARHGYPAVDSGGDLVALELAIWRFLYGTEGRP